MDINSETPPQNNIDTISTGRRFRVALSFSGDERAYVSQVAQELAQHFGSKAIFYDANYRAELARINLDTYLENIYYNDSDLVVLFFSDSYNVKTWCGLEWRAIRNLVHQRPANVVPVRIATTSLPEGLFPTDGYIPGDELSPQEVARDIISRYELEFRSTKHSPRVNLENATHPLVEKSALETDLAEGLMSSSGSAAYLIYLARERLATLFQQVDAETLVSMANRQRRFLPFGEPGAVTPDDRARRTMVNHLAAVLEHLSKTAVIGDLKSIISERTSLTADWYKVNAGFRADSWDATNTVINLRAHIESYELVLSCSKRNVAGVIEEGGALIPTSTSAILLDGGTTLSLSGLLRLSSVEREARRLRGSALYLVLNPLRESL